VTTRELNRALLARQMLLHRRRLPVARAVSRLVALQAQWAPSPYVALWSRVVSFRKQQLTQALVDGSVVKGASFRTTLHVLARTDFPAIASSYAETQRSKAQHVDALRRAIPDTPLSGAELHALAGRVIGSDDQWDVSFAIRPLPFVRTDPLGEWPHTRPSPVRLWREALPPPGESAAAVVCAYVAAYGPASREDVQQFTGFRLGQIDPALEQLRPVGDGLFDVPRAPRPAPDVFAPVRFLPAFDSMILAHRDRSRIVPPEYADAVFNKKNATTKNTFTVDGFVAGAWRIDGKRLTTDPFAPLPLRARREVDEEGAKLLAWYLG
jgi:hypothetical protein